MKLKLYKSIFYVFSFLSDKTNGANFFVKYKLLLGTLIIGLGGTTAQAQTKAEDTIPPTTPKNNKIITNSAISLENQSNKDSLIEIKGRVKDEHGEFIAGVSIFVKGTTSGTVSDIDGVFSIKATSNDKLVFSFLGMEKREVSASILRGGEAIITMKDSDMILCYDVVVVQYYPDDIYSRRTKKITKMSYTEVQSVPVSPVGDLENFEKWVQSNIRYSEQMKLEKVQGEVILSFAIDKKGRLVDKKVIGKLSKDADEEALRALSLSGAWQPGLNNGEPIKTTMTISLNFENE